MSNKIRLRSQSTQVILDAAREKGIKVEVFSKRFHLLKLTYNGKSLFIKGTSFPVNSQPACFIANNKFLTNLVILLIIINMKFILFFYGQKEMFHLNRSLGRFERQKKRMLPCICQWTMSLLMPLIMMHK